MAITFDPAAGFVLVPDACPDCRTPFYDTGCPAPGCPGSFCVACAAGCDIEVDPEGQCAAAVQQETPEAVLARVNAERAGFGLAPLT